MAYKMSLLERLEKAKPGRNLVFTAVETLRDPTEIRQFLEEIFFPFLQKMLLKLN